MQWTFYLRASISAHHRQPPPVCISRSIPNVGGCDGVQDSVAMSDTLYLYAVYSTLALTSSTWPNRQEIIFNARHFTFHIFPCRCLNALTHPTFNYRSIRLKVNRTVLCGIHIFCRWTKIMMWLNRMELTSYVYRFSEIFFLLEWCVFFFCPWLFLVDHRIIRSKLPREWPMK